MYQSIPAVPILPPGQPWGIRQLGKIIVRLIPHYRAKGSGPYPYPGDKENILNSHPGEISVVKLRKSKQETVCVNNIY